MQIEELSSEGLKREYKITVTKDDLSARLDAILGKFGATSSIKGFRPGKAPLSLLKKMHGERAMGQVLNETVQESSQKLMEEKNIRPASQPEIEVEHFHDGCDLEYRLKLEILPQIDVSKFKAPALTRWLVDADEAGLEESLKRIAGQQKNFKKAAKTAKAKAGDAVLIDFVGSIDGVAFEGGKGEDYQLELGSGSFIPGFEDQLIDAKEGEERVVKVNFPDDYQAENLKGKAAEFAVTVKEVRTASPAEVDEELAKNLGFENLDGLKKAVKEQLDKSTAQMTRAHLKRQLLDALADAYDFDVPASMVEFEFSQIWEQIKRDSVASGEAVMEDFEGQTGPADESEALEFRKIAERRVRLGLLLSEIGTSGEVTVSNEEVNRRMIEEARRFPGQEAQVFEFFQKNEQARAQLRAPIFEEKTVDYILELAELTEKKVSREELEAALQAMDEDEEAVTNKKPAKKAAKKSAKAEEGEKEAAKPKKASPKKTAAKKAD